MPLALPYDPRPLTTVTTYDDVHSCVTTAMAYSTGFGSQSRTWPSANLAVAYPIYMAEEGIVVKMFNANAATASGNIDIGLYDESFARIVSGGGVAQAGASILQVFDTTDTYIKAGRYYLAVACSSATSTHVGMPTTLSVLRMVGMFQMATAYPLPSTLTPAAITTSFQHSAGFSYRSLIS